MQATITIDFEVDGECPSHESLVSAISKLTSEAGYIGSEEIDGSEDWGLMIGTTTVSVDSPPTLARGPMKDSGTRQAGSVQNCGEPHGQHVGNHAPSLDSLDPLLLSEAGNRKRTRATP